MQVTITRKIKAINSQKICHKILIFLSIHFCKQVNDDWSAQTAAVPQASDWAAESTGAPMGAPAAQWGGSSNWN